MKYSEFIQELIKIAKEVKEADREGEKLGLTTDEVAFYNALETNDSAVAVLGDDTLKEIAREIADKIRANATIDWNIRESARAKMMVIVKRTLTKYGYPPDKQAFLFLNFFEAFTGCVFIRVTVTDSLTNSSNHSILKIYYLEKYHFLFTEWRITFVCFNKDNLFSLSKSRSKFLIGNPFL